MIHKFIFSDVDGCIINDGKPDFLVINTYLQRAINKGFDIVLTTAKTAREVISLNKALNLSGPFIVENGAGILFRSKQIKSRHILQIGEYQLLKLVKIKPDINLLLSFCNAESLLTQMSNEKLCSITGLSLENAILAKARDFTEPVYIEKLTAGEVAFLKLSVQNAKLHFIQTNRFLHISTSENNHKGYAIRFLLEQFYPNQQFQTFAIGDSINDFSMFEVCNEAFFLTDKLDQAYPKEWQILSAINFLAWQTAIDKIILHADKF